MNATIMAANFFRKIVVLLRKFNVSGKTFLEIFWGNFCIPEKVKTLKKTPVREKTGFSEKNWYFQQKNLRYRFYNYCDIHVIGRFNGLNDII